MYTPVDTVAAFTEPPITLPDTLFGGGSVSEQFNTSYKSARLWLNPGKDKYAPRVTYWRRDGMRNPGEKKLGSEAGDAPDNEDYPNGLLKLEFSLPQMAGGHMPWQNLTSDHAGVGLDAVDRFIAQTFDCELPPIREWTCQRVDYTWNWNVDGQLREYMTVLQGLRVSAMNRHPFDANEGVVWKAKNRWIKFYNKSLQLGLPKEDGEWLRYEVSNYKEAVKYMSKRWFDCERTVGELVHPERALFVMAKMWDKLGLYAAEKYGTEGLLLQRLVQLFGQRGAASANYHLRLMREYGTGSYSDGVQLTSSSTYPRWKKKLVDAGIVTLYETDDDTAIDIHQEPLTPLELPFPTMISEKAAKYVSADDGAESLPLSKISDENLRRIFGTATSMKSPTIQQAVV
jgi:hypothetical protein